MEGVERVLYNLPAVTKSQEGWICEGEKDADNLTALGYVATCNVGGAGKWLDGYTESLKGKDVVRARMGLLKEEIAKKSQELKGLEKALLDAKE